MYEHILVDTKRGSATITLNRPDKSNAMNGKLVSELRQALSEVSHNDEARVIVIKGAGKNFCGGADLGWMKTMSESSKSENLDDALSLATLLHTLYTFPKPTMVLAQGAAFGGALGLLAAADIVLAADNIIASFSEIKMALAPSTISPYVIAAIGARAARYYFLTGARFNAYEAYQMGLIHRIVPALQLDEEGDALAIELANNSLHAMKEIKSLIAEVSDESINKTLSQKTAEHLVNMRISPDAQEGLNAFLEKRAPKWR